MWMSVLLVQARVIKMLPVLIPSAPTPVSAKLDSQEMEKLAQVILIENMKCLFSISSCFVVVFFFIFSSWWWWWCCFVFDIVFLFLG